MGFTLSGFFLIEQHRVNDKCFLHFNTNDNCAWICFQPLLHKPNTSSGQLIRKEIQLFPEGLRCLLENNQCHGDQWTGRREGYGHV